LELPKNLPLHLHSREICFRHPKTKEIVHFQAPVPLYFKKTLKLCQFDPKSLPTSQLSDQEIEQFFTPKFKSFKRKEKQKEKQKQKQKQTSKKTNKPRKR
jgi:hypothetical protein